MVIPALRRWRGHLRRSSTIRVRRLSWALGFRHLSARLRSPSSGRGRAACHRRTRSERVAGLVLLTALECLLADAENAPKQTSRRI